MISLILLALVASAHGYAKGYYEGGEQLADAYPAELKAPATESVLVSF